MSNKILLQNLSYDLFTKVLHRWFKRLHEVSEGMEPQEVEPQEVVSRVEGDWLCQDPRSWYKGALIFPTFSEGGFEENRNSVTQARQDQEKC